MLRSGGGGGREALVQAVAVAGTPALPAVAVDGRLQLAQRAQAFLFTFKRIQVLHVPKKRWREKTRHDVVSQPEEENYLKLKTKIHFKRSLYC